MARRIVLSLCCLVMVAATLAAPDLRAQTNSGLRLVTELLMPGSNDTKLPHVAAARGRVHVSGNVNRTDAVYWTKADNGVSFPEFTIMGEASGQPDWSNTSVAVGPDGMVYYAWDDAPSRTIFLRTVDPAGNIGPTRTVDSGSSFPVGIEVTVSSKNEVFIAWRDPDQPAKFRYSNDGGVNWSSRTPVSDVVVFGAPLDLASGPGGKVAITFTAGTNDKLQIFTGLWDTSSFGFVMQRITDLDGDYSDSSVTFTPDGKVYTSWRGVAESGGTSGVFYAERQSNGSWPRSRIIGGKISGTVNLDSDEQGNLHLAWIGQPSGGNQLYYAFKPASDTFRGPVASSNTGAIYNAHAAASGNVNGLFEHVVMEIFSGSRLYTRYSLFQAEGAVYGATPLIEGGAAVVGGKSTAQVTFTDPTGVTAATTQVRWRWDAAPTNSASDSGGWQTYASPLSVPIPSSLLSNTSCSQSKLYTQLRDTQRGLVQEPAKSDSILVDGTVQGLADAHNPFINIPDALAGTAALPPQLALSKGAAGDGDPNYTRVPLIFLSARSLGDCSGLSSVAIGKSADAMEITYKTDSSGFNSLVPLPDLANIETGAQPVVVQIRDGAGNVQTSSFSIIFDDVAPRFVSADPPTATPSPYGDIIQDLSFTDVVVNDTYTQGSRHFWGVWLANSTTQVADPLNDPDLKWKAMPASGSGTSFSVEGWSLATGLDSTPAAGPTRTYYIYVRFLDGAGNATAEPPLELAVQSTSTRLEFFVPVIRR